MCVNEQKQNKLNYLKKIKQLSLFQLFYKYIYPSPPPSSSLSLYRMSTNTEGCTLYSCGDRYTLLKHELWPLLDTLFHTKTSIQQCTAVLQEIETTLNTDHITRMFSQDVRRRFQYILSPPSESSALLLTPHPQERSETTSQIVPPQRVKTEKQKELIKQQKTVTTTTDVEHQEVLSEKSFHVMEVMPVATPYVYHVPLDDNAYRRVLWTNYGQFVHMRILPQQRIGREKHTMSDQIFMVLHGSITVEIFLDDTSPSIQQELHASAGDVLIVPANTSSPAVL